LIAASREDFIYYNKTEQYHLDLAESFYIGKIKRITHDPDDKVFYALANKYHDKIGLALVRFDESNPFLHKYILNVNTKLEIDNADVSIMINKERNLKELIISYKTIYLNTFTIFVIDLSTKDFYTVFRHYSA